MAEVTKGAWTQSVPPAVAGGYVVDHLGSNRLRTHPLPQVVLTVSKHGVHADEQEVVLTVSKHGVHADEQEVVLTVSGHGVHADEQEVVPTVSKSDSDFEECHG